jgi:hypothetical protein
MTMTVARQMHPSDHRWRMDAYYATRCSIAVIEPAARAPRRRAGERRSVPFGFGVRKPHYTYDHTAGSWVRS